MRTTAKPISRMGTSVGMAGGSLADECCPEELAALVERGGGRAIRPGFDGTPVWGLRPD
jgi:hypothetical protein